MLQYRVPVEELTWPRGRRATANYWKSPEDGFIIMHESAYRLDTSRASLAAFRSDACDVTAFLTTDDAQDQTVSFKRDAKLRYRGTFKFSISDDQLWNVVFAKPHCRSNSRNVDIRGSHLVKL
eukprot:6193997-Pleurochrysis_carterae.AAC.3